MDQLIHWIVEVAEKGTYGLCNKTASFLDNLEKISRDKKQQPIYKS